MKGFKFDQQKYQMWKGFGKQMDYLLYAFVIASLRQIFQLASLYMGIVWLVGTSLAAYLFLQSTINNRRW